VVDFLNPILLVNLRTEAFGSSIWFRQYWIYIYFFNNELSIFAGRNSQSRLKKGHLKEHKLIIGSFEESLLLKNQVQQKVFISILVK
jgi:hypothetical protein